MSRMQFSKFKTEMNEEAFQILFDVMEKHFADLKILDSDSEYKLTRAVSFSELPATRRICVEQCYQSGDTNGGLVRQYSCEQILDKASNIKQLKISEVVKTGSNEHKKIWRKTLPCPGTINDSNWQFARNTSLIQAPKLVTHEAPSKVEYMEIEDIDCTKQSELSLHSIESKPNVCSKSDKELTDSDDKKEEIKAKNTGQNSYNDIKKKLRPLIPKGDITMKKKRNVCRCCCCLFVLLPVTLVIIGLIMETAIYKVNICNRDSNFLNASKELKERVYGQSDAINTLVDSFRQDISYIQIICLVGGTGVGKSYTAQIIGNNFPYKDKVYIHQSELERPIELDNNLPRNNLIIFENLKQNNLPDFVHSMKALQNSKEHCITVVAIFNMEYVENDLSRNGNLEENVKMIAQALEKWNINGIVVPYLPLNENAIEMCIQEAAMNSRLELTTDQFDRIKKSLVLSNTGCKGAYAKVQIIGRGET